MSRTNRQASARSRLELLAGGNTQEQGLMMLKPQPFKFPGAAGFLEQALKRIAMSLGTRVFELVELKPPRPKVVVRQTLLDGTPKVDRRLAAGLRKYSRSILESQSRKGEMKPPMPRTLVRFKGQGVNGIASVIRAGGVVVGVLALGTKDPKQLNPIVGSVLASAAALISRLLQEKQSKWSADTTQLVLGNSLRRIRQNYLRFREDHSFELARTNVALRHEIGERRRAENALRMLVDVTAAASEVQDLSGMLAVCLKKLCQLLDFAVGQAWIVDLSSNQLVCEPQAWYSSLDVRDLRQLSLEMRLLQGLDFPGMVWSARNPCFEQIGFDNPSLPRAKAAFAAGLEGHFGFPVITSSRLVAVLEFFSHTPSPPDERMVEAVTRLGTHLGIVFERLRNEDELRRQRAFTDRIISTTQEGIFAFDRDSRFTLWNPALERLFGVSSAQALGRVAFDLLPFLRESGEDRFFQAALAGKTGGSKDTRYRNDGTAREGFFDSYYSPMWRDNGASREVIGGLAIIHEVTDPRHSEDAMRSLSARLLKLQEEERRRISRELHDGPAQTVSAVSMYLAKIKQDSGSIGDRGAVALARSTELTNQAVREIRSLSYLLYPPELGSLGFASGLRLYAEGFAKRTGIEVRVAMPPRADALPDDVALALFRIAQQCLSNVHRHSGARAARVGLEFEDGHVRLQVVDNGRGFRPGVLEVTESGSSVGGVGISGIRDRVRQLGGELQIHSDSSGSQVIASIPLQDVKA